MVKKKFKETKEKNLFSFPSRSEMKFPAPRKSDDFQGKKIFRPQKLFQKSKYKLSCGAVIFHLDKGVPYYLLLKYPTYWGFVKGEVEPGETEEGTINRESAEEAGLYDLKIIFGFRETQHYFYKFEGQLIRKDAVYFVAETNSWKIKISHEHENYKWCTYDEAMSLIKVRANRELLTKAHLFLKDHYNQRRLF